MARPVKKRRVGCNPEANYFKPRGIPVADLDEVVLTMDELEAIRLADLEKEHFNAMIADRNGRFPLGPAGRRAVPSVTAPTFIGHKKTEARLEAAVPERVGARVAAGGKCYENMYTH